MAKNSATSSAVALAAAAAVLDPLDISIDPSTFTVADLRDLLSRYPADVPVRIGLFNSVSRRAKPDFFPLTRMVYGEIPSPIIDDESPEEAVALMFDTGITGEEFEGPHDGDRDHAAGIVAQAAASQRRRETKAERAARESAVANARNVVPLRPVK